MTISRRKFMWDAARGLMVPMAAGKIVRAATIIVPGPRRPMAAAGGGGNGLLTSLISHWKMNASSGTRTDSKGSNDLTDNGSCGAEAGKIGNAVVIVASMTQYLSIADNASVSLGADVAFALAGWIKINVGGSTTPMIFKATGSGNGTEYGVFSDGSNKLNFRVGNGSSNQTVATAAGLSTATWHFFAAWHDPSADKLNLSVDGGAAVQAAWSGGTQDTSSALEFGRIPYSTGTRAEASLDSISLYKRVLTTTDIANLYNSGAGLDYDNFTA